MKHYNKVRALRFTAVWLVIGGLSIFRATAQPAITLDLSQADPADGKMIRVHGSTGSGVYGVPVAGAFDCDADGHNDYAVAYFTASPLSRAQAGEVDLIFGDGGTSGTLDTSVDQARLLRIFGDVPRENCGSEIWMDDVTGDGFGDLLICRQNFSITPGRVGIGALTILVGGPAVREYADTLQPVDLRDPPTSLTLLHVYGRVQYDRLGIWARTGDIDGDGIADVIVAADQADFTLSNQGEVWVIRGGPQLAVSQTIDLINFGATALEGNLARITNAAGSALEHLGATCQLGDLDGNGRTEIFAAAALNRSGAGLIPAGAPGTEYQATGGFPRGRLYIVWDDNFPAPPWAAGYTFEIHSPPGTNSILTGANFNNSFGEEVLGGADFDGDGNADLFAGDLVGDGTPPANRPLSGVGFVFYSARNLKGLNYNLINPPPPNVAITRILGPSTGAIGADTVAQGDFDGDGFDDLMIGNPHDSPLGRFHAGSVHLLFGKPGGWPALIDTAPGLLPPGDEVRIVLIQGARGQQGNDLGDTLCYSAAYGDVDRDGDIDLIINEMVGNGVAPGSVDVGNLIILSGAQFAIPSVAARNFLLDSNPLNPAQQSAFDLNGDGRLDVADLILLVEME